MRVCKIRAWEKKSFKHSRECSFKHFRERS